MHCNLLYQQICWLFGCMVKLGIPQATISEAKRHLQCHEVEIERHWIVFPSIEPGKNSEALDSLEADQTFLLRLLISSVRSFSCDLRSVSISCRGTITNLRRVGLMPGKLGLTSCLCLRTYWPTRVSDWSRWKSAGLCVYRAPLRRLAGYRYWELVEIGWRSVVFERGSVGGWHRTSICF